MKIEYEKVTLGKRLWNGTTEVNTEEYEAVTLIDNTSNGSLYINYSYYYNDGTSMPNSTIEENFVDFVPNEKMEDEYEYWNNMEWDTIKITE